MPQNQNIQLKISNLILLLLISACAVSGDPTVTPSPSAEVTETEASITPSRTSAPTLEATITPHPTWTPLPTLPADEAIALAEELYATNAGCRLPCWWGITPGVTTWEEARQFYETFATEIIRDKSTQITERGVSYTETRYIVRYAVAGEYPVGAVGLYVIDGVISTIRMGRLRLQHTIQLHQMLEEYGPPTQIFVRTFSDAPFRPLPFILILFYEDQGILAMYDYDAERIGDILQSCPMPVGTVLWLWSQIIEMDDEDIEFRALGPDPNTLLRLLEDVTDYTIESFYQTFKEADNEDRIVTLIEYWEQ